MYDSAMTIVLSLLLAVGLSLSPAATPEDAPHPAVLSLALSGYQHAVESGVVADNALLTIIDYSRPSTEERLHVYDPATGEVLHASLVAHGKNSGQNLATRFGNEPGSLMSSLGFFVTTDTYQGKHGYSLHLRGLEPGINDNAVDRLIVIHGADYVSEEFAAKHGRLGRSWGCPALPDETAAEIIDLIKDGTCVYVHGNDSAYRQKSAYIP